MAQITVNRPPEESLPDTYDALIPIEQLIHGEHNPRRVEPTPELIESVANDGLAYPLIVRPDSEQEVYHITNGWQRYQAATQNGWEQLPVNIHDSIVAALTATEPEALTRDWTTYDWAQYCQSLASELDTETDSTYGVAATVAERITRSPSAVQQYLEVLSLPEEIHPLLSGGPTGTDQDWAALKNHNPDVRQYSGLRWDVAQEITRNEAVSADRQIGIAAIAVTFRDADRAIEFVKLALENPETRLEVVRKQVEFGAAHPQYLELPEAVRISDAEKQAIMDYCRRTQQSLSELIEQWVKEIATVEDSP